MFEAGPPLMGAHGVDATARDQLSDVDEAIRFLCYPLLKDVSDVVSKNVLCTLSDEWVELDKFRIKRRCLPLAFATLETPSPALSTSLDHYLHSLG